MGTASRIDEYDEMQVARLQGTYRIIIYIVLTILENFYMRNYIAPIASKSHNSNSYFYFLCGNTNICILSSFSRMQASGILRSVATCLCVINRSCLYVIGG